MARESPSKRKLRKKNKKRGIFSGTLFKLASAAFVGGCIVLVVVLETDCAKKEAELAEMQKKSNILEGENMEFQRILDNPDISAYMEKVAREEQGYAYPDEFRFYDTSRY